ncbi:unnamed protein product [Boreogadus saida]
MVQRNMHLSDPLILQDTANLLHLSKTAVSPQMFSLVKQTLLLRTHNQPGARSPQPVREPATTARLKAQPHLNRRPSPRSHSAGALLF